jgi:hypothetical protein
MTINSFDGLRLSQLPLRVRLLFTGFLLVTCSGLLMAAVQILLTHGMADGKPGLSIEDIKYSYHGNRSGSKLEAMLNGAMKPMAPDAVRFQLIQWARDGAPAADWPDHTEPLVQGHCGSCHNGQSSLPNFLKLEVLQQAAAVDQGESYTGLTRSSHIHLFSISFIFMFVGGIFAFAQFPRGWQSVLMLTPFLALFADTLSWWLTKLWPGFAWLTMISGLAYGVAGTVMIVVSLRQMWFGKPGARG